MAATENMTQIRCTYCLQELSYMTDPRQLTCGHIFCMKCLESDYASEEKQCRVCSCPFSSEEVGELKKVSPAEIGEYTSEPVNTKTDHKCDICKVSTQAVSYCIDCNRKLCHHHMKHHTGYFEASHETMDIAAYMKKSTCTNHPNETLCLGCTFCFTLACNECESPSCSQNGGNHKFVRVKEVGSTMHEQFETQLKRLSEQITSLCKKEKQAWQTFDGYTANFTRLIEDMEQRTEEQIAKIKENSKLHTDQIVRYQKQTSEAAENYINGINERIATLEQTYISVKSFLKINSIPEIAHHSQEKLKQLSAAIQSGSKVVDYAYSTYCLSMQGEKRAIEFSIRPNCTSPYYTNGGRSRAEWPQYVFEQNYGLN